MLSELLLLERLSDADLALLAKAAGEPGSQLQRAARLRERPAGIDGLLARREVFSALFDEGGEDPIVVVGPFVAFAVLLAQTPAIFEELTFVPERVGRRSTVPVFEVEPLREFVAEPLRRLFLADLLASYTHVASGALWVRSRRGWRHRRFSELDPAQFAELILTVPPDQRLVLYRRLGDLTLFLSGVFPDYVSSRTLTPIAVERLRRAVGGGQSPSGGRRGRAVSRRAVSRRRRTVAGRAVVSAAGLASGALPASASCACWSGSGGAPTASRGTRPATATSASRRSSVTSPSTSATPA